MSKTTLRAFLVIERHGIPKNDLVDGYRLYWSHGDSKHFDHHSWEQDVKEWIFRDKVANAWDRYCEWEQLARAAGQI